jgi:hypothetical protein
MRLLQTLATAGLLALAGCGYSVLESQEGPAEAAPEASLPAVPRSAAPPYVEVPPVVDAGSQGGDAGPPPPPPECSPGAAAACPTECGSQGTKHCTTASVWSSCATPSELCGNGVDDDCDGKVDSADADCPPSEHLCEQTEGNGCNGDLGYGDRCAASDNESGCSAGRFWAWCNRRNTAYPNIWDDWIRNWVDARCDGAVVENGNTFECTSSSNERYTCTTPLVLSFDSGPVVFNRSNERFALVPGLDAPTDWPSAATPWLALDRDGSGAIEDGRELFGSATTLGSGATALNGFEALAELDANRDGVVDAADPSFRRLLVWRDANADRVSQPSELVPAGCAGLVALELSYHDAARCDARGNCERERAVLRWRDAQGQPRVGAVVDVHLRLSPSAPAVARP